MGTRVSQVNRKHLPHGATWVAKLPSAGIQPFAKAFLSFPLRLQFLRSRFNTKFSHPTIPRTGTFSLEISHLHRKTSPQPWANLCPGAGQSAQISSSWQTRPSRASLSLSPPRHPASILNPSHTIVLSNLHALLTCISHQSRGPARKRPAGLRTERSSPTVGNPRPQNLQFGFRGSGLPIPTAWPQFRLRRA